MPGLQRIFVVATTASEAELLHIRADLGRRPVVLTAPTAEAKRVEAEKKQLAEQATRDLQGEGFDPDKATFAWELRGPNGTVQGEGRDPSGLADTLEGEPTLGRLTASYPLPRLTQPDIEGSGNPRPTGSRPSLYGVDSTLPTYDASDLAGRTLDGPLLADGGSFTWLVTDGWSVDADSRGDAALIKKGA